MTQTDTKIRFLCLTGVAGLLLAGCMSVGMRFKERSQVTVPEKIAKPFCLERVELTSKADRNSPHYKEGVSCPPLAGRQRDNDFGDDLTRRAETRYPQLFSRDPKAVPFTVRIDHETVMKSKGIPLFLMTLTLAGLVFPSWPPDEEHRNFHITLDAGEGQIFGSADCSACEFRWMSFYTPFAMLGVPGESDIPKKSGVMAWADKNFQERERDAILDEIVESIAAVLVKTDPASLPARRTKPGAVREVPLPDTFPLPNF
ncbi:MAG: hypothetical protein RBT78_07065 [Kiritimatiellia bacterium]|jgi:hypothetical protein|nr:hypothetical protein [Kiritimatiellia bacterium]